MASWLLKPYCKGHESEYHSNLNFVRLFANSIVAEKLWWSLLAAKHVKPFYLFYYSFFLSSDTWPARRSMKLNCSSHLEFSATHHAQTLMKRTLMERNPSLARGWISSLHLLPAVDVAVESVWWGELTFLLQGHPNLNVVRENDFKCLFGQYWKMNSLGPQESTTR